MSTRLSRLAAVLAGGAVITGSFGAGAAHATPTGAPVTTASPTAAPIATAVAPTVVPVAASTGGSSGAGTDSRPIPRHLFAYDSFWYRTLPASTPTDPQSVAMVKQLYRTGEQVWGKPGKPNVTINIDGYTPGIYVATNSDPVATFRWNNCMDLWDDRGLIKDQLTDLHIPDGAAPAAGSDGEMVIYNKDAQTYTEVWNARQDANGQWSACWGGTLRQAGTSSGIFPRHFSATATGLPFGGGIIRADELQRGEIDHVVGLAIPYAKVGVVSWPANRGDGKNPANLVVPAQGQMVRLPADLDLNAMKLSPTARTIAKAVQKYGAVIWDTGGVIGFRAENPQSLRRDPYPTILRGAWPQRELEGDPARGEVPFPLDKLQVLPMNYEAPVTPAATSTSRTTTTTPGAPTTTAPTSAPTTSPTPRRPTNTASASLLTLAQGTASRAVRVPSGRFAARGTSYVGGSTSTAMARKAIGRTSDDAIYATALTGVKQYRAVVPNGAYRVQLFFAEDRYGPRQRVFDVLAEGRVVLRGLDIARVTGGLRRAYQPVVTVVVKDGTLNLGFRALRGTPTLSAVRLTQTAR